MSTEPNDDDYDDDDEQKTENPYPSICISVAVPTNNEILIANNITSIMPIRIINAQLLTPVQEVVVINETKRNNHLSLFHPQPRIFPETDIESLTEYHSENNENTTNENTLFNEIKHQLCIVAYIIFILMTILLFSLIMYYAIMH